MRRPEPFYRQARKGWYVQLNGKQHLLGKAEKETASPPIEVMQAYMRLMGGEGLLTDREKRKANTIDIVNLFIESKEGRREGTITACLTYLNPFVAVYGNRKLDLLKPTDIRKWVDSRDTWSESTKHMAIVYVKQLFAWARRTGIIESDPLTELRNPYAMESRDRYIELEEFEKMLQTTKNPALATMIRFLRDTGCRPSELCKLTAKHLHRDKPQATLNPREHKTGERTGKSKTITFAAPVIAELRELAKVYPTGTLLRTVKGLAWNTENLQKRVKALREKCGLDDHVFPYASRTALVTRLGQMGVEPMMISKIVGHVNVETTLNNYFKPQADALSKAMDAAMGVQPTPKAETQDEVIARLTAEIAALKAENAALRSNQTTNP